ncbi:hypothetical protein TSUD_303160 [Trifolium subterraneum]|uniref:Reverse transcriptase domain-containing protein n=1 Tax=Trifolium subterraneum TaxID=3900 RepID=A0A2Z6P2H7_TRISU|nr:hypothetical protein TSUD_303160 [Trifolium subterraneum]
MPKNTSQIQLIRGMDEKIASLEAEMSGVKTSLANMEQNQARLIALFEKSLGKKIPTEEEKVEEVATKTNGEGSDTRPEVKVNLAQLCMEGPTIHFFNSLINEDEDLLWDRLKEALLERYGGHGEGDVYEQLTELRQRGSVDEYITDFEYLTAQIPSKEGGTSGGVKSNGIGPKSDKQAQYDKRRSNHRDRGFTQLSYNEVMERKQKGLCFKCGGAFHPMHQCPDRQLKVLLVDDEEEEEQGGKLLVVEVESEEEEAQGEMSRLELQQLHQFNHQRGSKPQVIKLRGAIHEVPVIILIDSGASHNFISQQLVQKMSWKTIEEPAMSIKLGDGSCAKTKGVCEGLEIEMEELKIRVDAQIFYLGCVDVVLGIEWLRTLGDMIVNWQKQTMSFWYNRQWVTMKGMEDQLGVMETLYSAVCKPWWNEVTGWKKNKVNSGVFHTLEDEQSREMEQLLNMCAGVFQEPKGLPPKRMKEHEITLKEGQEAVNYRALNKVTIPDKFLIPVIEELLDELHGAKYFSKLDLKSGYHQVRVKEEDVHKTAFRTHEGHYEFMVMPFGLMNAPYTFQSLMNEVFKPLLRKTVLVFFDDILVYSKSWQEHLRHLAQVLKVLQTHGLVANKKKCQFCQQSIEYLGHLINGEGVAVDPSKVVSVTNWPVPKNVKGVRGFLGLTGYYRKFIRDYGKLAKPLTELTKKNAFVWSEAAGKAFDSLKKSLTTAPVLALPDFSKEFIVECDASGGGIGAILMQSKRPIAYFSKALRINNLVKSAYEKELMAVVLAIQHWRPYLIGRRFIVSTDQKSLKQLLQQRMVTADQQNWAAKLLGYDFEIVYKPGKLNR